jgi:hypothetical protein
MHVLENVRDEDFGCVGWSGTGLNFLLFWNYWTVKVTVQQLT